MTNDYKETEIGTIPADWKAVDFSEMVVKDTIRVGKVKQQDIQAVGEYPVIDQGQQKIAGYFNDERLVYQGSLPVIIFGDHTRIFKLIDFPFICGADGTKVLIPNRRIVDPYSLIGITPYESVNSSYLEYYLQTQQPKMDRMAPRGTQKNINIQFLQPWPIPLPTFIEQARIAEILHTANKKFRREQSRKVALEALFKSVLHQLMTGQIRVPA